MKKIIRYGIATVLACASVISCHKADPQFPDVINEEIYYDVSSRLDRPAAFIGGAGADFLGQAIRSRVVNEVPAEKAEVIFITSADLMANAEFIRKAWLDGRAIVELWPSVATHSTFWKSIGAPVYLSGSESDNDLILLSVCRYSCYQLQNPFLDGIYGSGIGEIPQDAPVMEDSADAPTPVNYTAIEIARTSDFINTKLNSLVEWANTDYSYDGAEAVNDPTPTFDGDLTKRIENANAAQIIRKTFQIGVDDFQIDKYPLSNPDKVTRHSTIDLTMHIVPLYSYEKNGGGKNGDYYFVDMNIVSHNEALCKDYYQRHGALPVFAHIFYGRAMDWKATLVNKSGSSYERISSGLNFFETPVPQTTENSSSYTSGFTGTLDINGQLGYQGGLNGSLTVGGMFSWNNMRTETVADQSIEMSTDPNTRGVHYCYYCNNDQMTTDDLKEAVKAIARSDQKCNASWCWHVNTTKDDDSITQFAVEFELNPVYRYMQRRCSWASGSCWRYDKKDLLGSEYRKFHIDVQMPNRARNGIVEIKSTTNKYMTKLVIKDQETQRVVAEDKGAYEKNLIQRYQVPVGTYMIEYNIQDGEGGDPDARYRISDVTVNTAETTTKSSYEGKRIEGR